MENLSGSIIGFLTEISSKFGTGVLVNDVLVFLLTVSFLTLVIALAAYRQTYNLKTPPGLERVTAIAGKVEKLEMNLGEFRIETVRNLELFRGDLGYLKQELAEISRVLKTLSSGGSGGGSSLGGGAPSGSGVEDESAFKSFDTGANPIRPAVRPEEELPVNPLAHHEGYGTDLTEPRFPEKKND